MYYKDMEVWKESMALALMVYKLTDKFPFIEISIGSLAELDTQLILSKDLGYYIEDIVFNQIKKVNALLLGLKKYLKNNKSEAD